MALKYVIDTSAYSAFNRDQYGLEKFINPRNSIFIPLIVIAELRSGFQIGAKKQLNESLLLKLLDASNSTILRPSEETTKFYAQIYAQLRKIGKPLSTNDIWIAALCLEHKLPLLTLDRGFKHIEKLVCLAL